MSLITQLPFHLERRIVECLPHNEIACVIRTLNAACAATYRSYTVVRLSQPVPHWVFAQQWGVNSPALRALKLSKREELIRLTASSGVLENLVLALDSAGCLPTNRLGLIEAAAAAGHLHICLFLEDRGLALHSYTLFTAAAGAGRRDVCEQLIALGFVPSLSAAAAAAKGGHVGLMDWLLALVPHRDIDARAALRDCPQVIKSAAYGCDLATLQRLLTAWLPAVLQGRAAGAAAGERQELLSAGEQQWCVDAATRSPTPDWRSKVEWLEGRFLDLPRAEYCEAAALPDAAERLAWLRGRGYPVGKYCVDVAAEACNTATLTYLLEEAGVQVADAEPTTTVARKGHLAALQLLVARGCPVNAREAVHMAGGQGNLAVVIWLVETLGLEVSELSPWMTRVAAYSGNLELLGWLRERGAPWHDTFAGAVAGGCEAVLEWLVERGCPLGDGNTLYAACIRCCDVNMVRCLRRLGVRWGPDDAISRQAVRTAPLVMLRWLVEVAGMPVEKDVLGSVEKLEEAVRYRRRDKEAVLDWLLAMQRRQESAGLL